MSITPYVAQLWANNADWASVDSLTFFCYFAVPGQHTTAHVSTLGIYWATWSGNEHNLLYMYLCMCYSDIV